MLLVQKFKTFEGCRKRAEFETQHPTGTKKTHYYVVVRFLDGEREKTFSYLDKEKHKAKRYHWQIEKLPLAKK